MTKKRILFLGETYRADAITWMNGLRDFGDFEIVTWELQTANNGINRLFRLLELAKALLTIKKIAKRLHPDMIIAERTTSYGFLAAYSGIQPIAIAQQGITDLWPENTITYPLKKRIQKYAFQKANLIHAWGEAMADHMKVSGDYSNKIMILPKGINLDFFEFQDASHSQMIHAVVTRSLFPEYQHLLILKAFGILKQKNIPFKLVIIGDGPEMKNLKNAARQLQIANETEFTGWIENTKIPTYLQAANYYISTPVTEGVSASLFEAMACGCFPIVSDLPGNQHWIQQKINGILVGVKNEFNLAEELQWAFRNPEFTQKVILANRKFVEENANYKINMKKIALKYHELIAAVSTTV
ncbi:glycosyltransferase [Flavobacterium sedimenticola]|uniref:Glycosyltransferase n=1 Tax=Flavobacterium sedimenticola TaxID=3043286 RepID=A0ABT6XQ33_9FLAO|nr:glycosyltransferase [Flavobacterium sedimenticola]MDI9257201.1 glycosyltransferase [Flavobacterium sedimenticola]